MKRYAVAVASLFENDNIVEIIEAVSWQTALHGHSAFKGFPDTSNDWIARDLEYTKQYFFNSDLLIDVKEIP